MKKIFILSILGLFLGAPILFAQNGNVIQIEVLKDSDEKQDSTIMGKLHNTYAIKLNPLLYFRGDVPLYLEVGITRQFTVETGVGFTHTDYLSAVSEMFKGFDYGISNIHSELGYSARLGFRYYASNYGFEPEGMYFAIEGRRQVYNATLTDINKSLKRINNDFRVTIGYVNYFENNVFIEPYLGFGIRARGIDVVTGDTVTRIDDSVPLLSLGFKLGILL